MQAFWIQIKYKSPKLEIDALYPYSCNGSIVPEYKLRGQLRALTQGIEIIWWVQELKIRGQLRALPKGIEIGWWVYWQHTTNCNSKRTVVSKN